MKYFRIRHIFNERDSFKIYFQIFKFNLFIMILT